MWKIILLIIGIVVLALLLIVTALAINSGKMNDRAVDDEMQMRAIAEMNVKKQGKNR